MRILESYSTEELIKATRELKSPMIEEDAISRKIVNEIKPGLQFTFGVIFLGNELAQELATRLEELNEKINYKQS